MKIFALAVAFASVAYAQTNCPAQSTFDGCISAIGTLIATCQPQDYKCLCTYNTQKVNCYNQCPNDPIIQGEKQNQQGVATTYCAQVPNSAPSPSSNSTTPSGNNSTNSTSAATMPKWSLGGAVALMAITLI